MTEKIDHKEQALSFLHTRHDGAAAAQVYATLYLAEQQAAAVEQARIANLIALDQHEVRG
ncbi:hypothetical protein M2390_002581, partial [Mycetocola sp. BIGb0189]|nr:hypothetical protein [Mycetocola sp. BIGb0189]